MSRPYYRGARGAKAGDDFHELWALRQALALLTPGTNLNAVTVEGLRAEDESGTPQDTWDGVDCTFYYGGDQLSSAERVEIHQLKYSAANPDQQWTGARLIYSTNRKQDNSVIGRLSKAFKGLMEKRPDLVASGNLVVRLVSNQQADPTVSSELSDQSTSYSSIRVAFQKASGLHCENFAAFMKALDLSKCGSSSRFAIEESVLATISDMTDDDARVPVNHLLRSVRNAMMPESKGEYITCQSIIAWMGFSDLRALFPCPSAIKWTERLVPRKVSRIITEQVLNGQQRICIHGEAGCGKTTVLRELEALLPHSSIVVTFDCYGGGRYLDSDAYRHRPQDAFLELSNDLALQLQIPFLVSRSAAHDYPRVFKKRLEMAAEVVASRAHDALVVVIIDAADNSVTAASTRLPPEKSFIHDFMSIGELPNNVRFAVTARTGRLDSLNLPRGFIKFEVTGFSRDETAAHVRGIWKDAPEIWIDDFHHLSRGNPRVQWNTLDWAGEEPSQALDYLRPTGKNLDHLFHEQFEHARHKVGNDQDIKIFCSGLIALPRPVPIADLSLVTRLSQFHILDLCNDLAPGVRLTNGSISFSDEDFEHFVRTEAEDQLSLLKTRIADHFIGRHRSDAYAATHIAAALLAAGRRQEIIDFINTEHEPTAIGDPVLRREVQLQRLRIAMKVCRETSNNVEAILTLLIGAEALKTDAVIRHMLIENSDLAANFASDTSGRIILRDPDEIENHGPLLFHIMAVDSRNGDGLSVREGSRQVNAWLQRRNESFKDQKREHPNSPAQGWEISDDDIAAETEAILRIAGPNQAINWLQRWSPKHIALSVASILSSKLITSGEDSLVQRCLTEGEIRSPWDLFLLTPLALTGNYTDLSRIETSLLKLLRHGLIRLDKLKITWNDDNFYAEYLDLILTSCEIVFALRGNRECIVPILEQFADKESRRRDQLFTSQVHLIDLSLRAHALLERLAGRKMSLESYWIEPLVPSEELSSKELEKLKRADGEKKEELKTFIGPIMEMYDVRAQALMGLIVPGDIETHLRHAITSYHSEDYRLHRHYRASAMRTQAALSVTRLMVIPNLDHSVLFDCASAVLNSNSTSHTTAAVKIFANFALDRSLHPHILKSVTARAKTVKSMKTSAEDKIAALVDLARLLLPISDKDAESLFNEAVTVASEVNADAVHEIALFAPLTERAVVSMSVNARRTVARDLAIVVSDTRVRLAGSDHFPWKDAARALATMNIPFALAVTGRWEDSNIVDRVTLLPSILETALSHHEMTPVQVSALSSLLDEFSVELIGQIVDEAISQKDDYNPIALSEHLAHEELLRFSQGRRDVVTEKLRRLLLKDGPGYWINQLTLATKFHQTERPRSTSSLETTNGLNYQNKYKTEISTLLADFDWVGHGYGTPGEISKLIDSIFAKTRASETYISIISILDWIENIVAITDRVLYLETLRKSQSIKVADYELAQAITRCVMDWNDSPSVSQWCREHLLKTVVELLPGFSRWLAFGQSPLPALLEQSGIPDLQICNALLDGIERHVDALDAPTVYALVGLIGRYSSPKDTVQVIARYAYRLVQRIPPLERDIWDLNDIPKEVADSIARYLYSLMGDVDVRIRWRAAHALYNLTLLGDVIIIDRLIELYDRISEPSYREPSAPFYWLAARLWLMIALDKIAVMKPEALRNHGQWLLKIAGDEDFPHVLLRSFTKSTVTKLVESKNLELDPPQQEELARANTSLVPRMKGQKSYQGGFERYTNKESEGRRFSFDSMDTLPYWYSEALRVFANVSGKVFLDAAERWIVDCWDVKSNPWMWVDEPRQKRLADYSMGHRQGSLPILERFHTYLEWHAMWCAAGELMQKHPLAKTRRDDDYYTFENWLARDGLTMPAPWLSDLHSPKPLEDQFWFAPQNEVDFWIDDVGDDEFLTELGLTSKSEMIIVGSTHETRSRGFKSSVRVHTALVSPETAGALMRALQTINDSWDYRIPPAGDNLEINNPPYKFLGWLIDDNNDLGIDEGDPLRYEVRSIEYRPSIKTEKYFNLTLVLDDQAKWVNTSCGTTVFVYQAWGDNNGDERDERLRYDETVRSSGWRLHINKEDLRNFLDWKRLDLIVEIEITRKNKGYDYSRYDEEKTKESRFDRVLLLRRDGSIEATEGCIGTWATPRT